jgi:hypothetical protein
MMDRLDSLEHWLSRVSGSEWSLHAKRLSANDTGLTGSHQVGFYIPREFTKVVAPDLTGSTLNPRRRLHFEIVNHDQVSRPSLIYYNSLVFRRQPNGRNEFRVTGFGGRRSILQEPETTGAILVSAWATAGNRVEAWLAGSTEEEDAIEAFIGPVEPGTAVLRVDAGTGQLELLTTAPSWCHPDIGDLPATWLTAFPPGRELTDEAVRRRPERGETADRRLLARYRCEFGLFKVVEDVHTVPLIVDGFASVDEFLAVAQTVANRRKSRAGRSLELHLARIFDEEGVSYETGQTTEGTRKPDFVFPSIASYRTGLPTTMLGVKTSVKDRWRQVLDEAARIPEKHLFTLSEGVSPDQFHQMREARLTLVVPAENLTKFPQSVRSHLLTLSAFVRSVT